MLLVVDVGNTNIVLGVYKGEDLVVHWRIATKRDQTADEYGILIQDLFKYTDVDPKSLKAAIISSVVPPVTPILEEMLENYFSLHALQVGPGTKTGVPVLYDNPKEVGADRIVNAVAAYKKYGGPAVVVDFGTATTFDVISSKGEYLGGVIVPGIGISTEALFERAAKLPRIEIAKPKNVIGRDTVSSMQSGIYYGYVSLVDGIIDKIEEELDQEARVIATGGLASLIAKESKKIKEVDPWLTLEGLRLIYERNR